VAGAGSSINGSSNRKNNNRDSGSGGGKKAIKIIALITLYIILMMAGFVVAYKYAINSGTRESVAIYIPPEEQIVINIPLGSSTSKIASILKEEELIGSEFLFRLISSFEGYDNKYKSGNHIVAKGLKYTQIMDILIQNPQAVRVTIPEGYNWYQIVSMLDKLNLISKDVFEEAANNLNLDLKSLKDIPNGRKPRFEGYLYPDTYEFGSDAKEKDIIERLLLRFDDIFLPEYYDKARELGMTVDEIITLASIIEREAKLPEERAIIAGVFYNRLKSGDVFHKKLESCATIQYILFKKEGKIKEVISIEDTKIDDPYNTYIHEGLPPGPICCPGKASIEAALNPQSHDYYYFVAKGDGSHHFSKTLEEHEAAMRQYGVAR